MAIVVVFNLSNRGCYPTCSFFRNDHTPSNNYETRFCGTFLINPCSHFLTWHSLLLTETSSSCQEQTFSLAIDHLNVKAKCVLYILGMTSGNMFMYDTQVDF